MKKKVKQKLPTSGEQTVRARARRNIFWQSNTNK